MNVYSLDPMDCPACGLAGANAGAGDNQPWMQTGDCEKYLKLVETYTRLSNKTDKSKTTRENAAKFAAGNQLLYNQCMEQKAKAAVQGILQPQAAPAPAPAGTATSLPIPPTPIMAAPSGQSWLAENKWLLIGGGVLVAGLVAYMVLRKK